MQCSYRWRCFHALAAGPLLAEEAEALKNARDDIRKSYEEKGYTEVDRAYTVEAVCDKLDIPAETRDLAYRKLEDASPEMQKLILEARMKIIYSSGSWYVDDGGMYMVWFNDNTREWGELPTFSALFPGWDVPTEPADVNNEQAATSLRSLLFNGIVDLPRAVAGVLSKIFYTWNLGSGT